MASPIACGIDFGTSNSTVGVAENGKRHLVALEDNKTTLPSAIFFQKTGPIFGRAAIDAYISGDEGRFMRGLKKILGTPLMNDKTLVGNRSITFTEILQIFITQLKTRAEDQLGAEINHVIMGRPVHFHDDDEKADIAAQDTLQKIANDVGFREVGFLYEPIAAAFAHEIKFTQEKLSLVVDLGGGTSDFTVISLSQEKTKKHDRRDDILSTSGVRVGGTTFDYRLSLARFMNEFGMGTKYRDVFDKKKTMFAPTSVYFQLSDWAMANFAQTKKAIADTMDIKRRSLSPDKFERLLRLQENHLGHALLGKVEETKISLSDQEKFTARFLDIGDDFAVNISRHDFEQSIEQDVTRIFDSIDQCLSEAGITADKINLVILTGGSTELPLINRMVRDMFPHAEISQENKLDSVGLGLAYRAGNVF
jgi:hypothetical chaperone protein